MRMRGPLNYRVAEERCVMTRLIQHKKSREFGGFNVLLQTDRSHWAEMRCSGRIFVERSFPKIFRHVSIYIFETEMTRVCVELLTACCLLTKNQNLNKARIRKVIPFLHF